MKDGQPFTFAGLWDKWKKPNGEDLHTFTIITTTPNELCEKVHDRMPVILPTQQFEQWLDPKFNDADKLQSFLRPYPAMEMTCYPVSLLVNNPRNDDPHCIEPVKEESLGLAF